MNTKTKSAGGGGGGGAYCDECVFVEFVKVEATGEFLTLCGKTMTRCTEERSGLFKDACGPTGKNFKRDT